MLLSVALLHRDALLLRADHVHRLHQLPFGHENVVLRHSVDKVVHVGERKVDGTKAREQSYDGDSNHADSGDALLDGEDSSVDAEKWERIADAPEAVEVAQPEEYCQRR